MCTRRYLLKSCWLCRELGVEIVSVVSRGFLVLIRNRFVWRKPPIEPIPAISDVPDSHSFILVLTQPADLSIHC